MPDKSHHKSPGAWCSAASAGAGETKPPQANVELSEVKARLQSIFEGVETGIFIIDPDTHQIVDANPTALRQVGASIRQVVGATCHSFICPAEKGRCPVTDLRQTVDNSERVLLTVAGEKRAIIKSVRSIQIGERHYLLESFLDITDRKRAEQTLAERTAYLNTLFELSPLGIIVLDQHGAIQMANSAAERLFLYSREEMLGLKVAQLLPPEDLAEESRRSVEDCLSGRSVHFITRRQRRDHSVLVVEVYGVPLLIPGHAPGVLVLYQDITARRLMDVEMAERHRLATMAGELGSMLTGAETVDQGLRGCMEILARRMEVACARAWTLESRDAELTLRAQSGCASIAGEDGGRDEVSALGLRGIADGDRPEYRSLEAEEAGPAGVWLRARKMAAFAACPLKVADRGLGLVAVLSRRPMSEAARQAFESASDSIAQFVERKRAEASLRASEDRFRTAFEEAPYGMCMTAPGGGFLHANAALCEMLGYTLDELLRGAWHDITFPEDLEKSRLAVLSFERDGAKSLELEKRYLHKNGRTVWVRLKILAVRDAAGSLSHYITQVEDITDSKRATGAQAFLVSLVESSQDAIVGTTPDGMVVSWNSGAAELYGYSAQEMTGKPASIFGISSRPEDQRQLLERICQGERITGYEVINIRKDGRRIDVSLALSPVFDGDGRVTGIAIVGRDITQRKLAELALQSSEEKFRQLAENVREVFWIMSPSGDRVLYVSPAYEQVWGRSCASLYGNSMAWTESIHPDDVEQTRRDFARQLQGELIDSVYRIRTPEGQEKWIRDRAFPVRARNGRRTGIVGLAEDISERKLAEERMRASEERYRELFENASDLVYTFDLNLQITSLNRMAEETMGYRREEALGMTLSDVVGAGQWDRVERAVANLGSDHAAAKFEVEVQAKDGRRVNLEVNPRLIYRDGVAVGIQAIARDVTGRNQAEMELRQAQKLESVGRLASGIAHEINTPMQFVGDNVHFLEDCFSGIERILFTLHAYAVPAGAGGSDPSDLAGELLRLEKEVDTAWMLKEIPEAIRQTLDGVERVVTIVRAMKEFAHPESRGRARADLNKALLNTLTVARNELKYVANVETDFHDLPLVDCSVSDLNQVFLNLLVNAAHAIADVVRGTEAKGTIRLHTEMEDGMVLITIADTGAGIPESIRERIFDPFFTTKEVGRGTGQGLAIARAVIDRHKGKLTFESEVGKGTTFFIRLPIEDSARPGVVPD
jgi:two-component system NtrC family sensor kinase